MRLYVDQTYYICEYEKKPGELAFVGKVAGLGRNRGTWNTAHSLRTAQRHARTLRAVAKTNGTGLVYKVETL